MNDFNNDEEHESLKPVFLKGCAVVAGIIVLLIVGFLFSLGILSAVNKVSPLELLKGKSQTQPQLTQKQENTDTSTPKPTAEKEQTDLSLQQFNEAITSLVENVTPSVVNLNIKVKNLDGSISEGIGSGVIYSEDGYIITNDHVAGKADEIIVKTYEGKEYAAKLIGSNKDTDIAVIKVEALNLKKAEFASINDVKAGELVIAIGSPFAIDQTVTLGVVSAKGRDITISMETLPMVDLIQTDAAINPGNSGGPLINIYGKVIGINTLIFSPSGTSAGIGFAIPSDTAVNIAEQIIKFKRAKIPYLGIEMGDNNSEIEGVLVSSVLYGYPASKAGIEAGDILTKIDGAEIRTNFELLAQMLRRNVGDEIEIEIYRNSQYIVLKAVLVESPVTAVNN